jgi:hypothetical protein
MNALPGAGDTNDSDAVSTEQPDHPTTDSAITAIQHELRIGGT